MAETSGVKIPVFINADPALWFLMCEATFELASPKAITESKTKYNYCVSHLPPDAASMVRDIIINPDATDPYTQLKEHIISKCGETKAQEIRRLLAGEQLGDRKPSELLRVMQRRAKAHTIADSLMLELFLQQLPANVQAILASISPLTTQKAAEVADRILEVTPSEMTTLTIIINFSFAQVSVSPYTIQPYSFGYTVKDKFGDQHRQETGDGQKLIKGSYGYQDSQGLHRQVDYIADKDGFRAEVKTNEPGTASQNPAAVQMISSAHPYFGIGSGFGGGAGGSGKDAGKASFGNFAGIRQGLGDGLGYEDGTKGQELGTYLGYKGLKGLGYSNGFGYGTERITDKGFGNGFGYGIGGMKGLSFDAGFGYGNGGMKGHAFNNGFGYGARLKGLGYDDSIGYGNGMKSLHGTSGYGAGVRGLGLGNIFRYGGKKGGKGVSDIALSFKRTGYDDIAHDGYTLEI